MDQPRGRRAAPRAPRQAVVAGPPRRGPARATTGATRWTARRSRRSAGARRVAFEDGPGRDRRLVSSRTRPGGGAAKSGDWDAVLRAPVRRPRLPRATAADARRRHRRDRAARAALVAALADAPFTGPAGPIAWDRPAFDLDAPDGVGDAARPRPARGRRPRRGLDRRRRLRPRPGARAAPQRRRDRGPRRGLRRARASTSSSSRPTRSSTGPGPTASATARRPDRAAATRTARPSWPASAPRATPSTAPAPAGASGSSGRPGCSGRRAATSRARSSTRPSGRAAAGEPLRVVGDEWGTPTYAADVADAIVELLAEDAARRASTTSSTG